MDFSTLMRERSCKSASNEARCTSDKDTSRTGVRVFRIKLQ